MCTRSALAQLAYGASFTNIRCIKCTSLAEWECLPYVEVSRTTCGGVQDAHINVVIDFGIIVIYE